MLQVVKEVHCPSCGAQVALLSNATEVASCSYCGNLMVINQEAIESKGEVALLADTPSCLAVGWPAKLLGKDITTLGRIQFQYSAGIWDEWWVRLGDTGEDAWISQDEGSFMLEMAIKDLQVPAWESLNPGDKVLLEGREFFIEEKDTATMVGIQGELPFRIIPYEKMRYLDLGGDGSKATISYFEDGDVEAYIGRYLEAKDLDVLEGGVR